MNNQVRARLSGNHSNHLSTTPGGHPIPEEKEKLWAGGNSEVEVKPQSDGTVSAETTLPVSVDTNKTFTKCLELKTILKTLKTTYCVSFS